MPSSPILDTSIGLQHLLSIAASLCEPSRSSGPRDWMIQPLMRVSNPSPARLAAERPFFFSWLQHQTDCEATASGEAMHNGKF
jgi:hypothetical protein